ncbi:MAG: cytochrome b/b6 domain-containing protein [Actinomycetota bacterium]
MAEAVRVWDLPTRVFHWLLVALFAGLWISGSAGKLDLHMKLGAATLALLLFRIAWGLVGSRTARFADFLAGPRMAAAYLRGQWHGLGHNPLGGWSVMVLLSLLTVQACAGLFTSDDILTDGPLVWMVSAKTVKLLSAVHRVASKLLLVFVALHVGAVAWYRLAKGENLVLPMVTGCKTVAPEMAAKAARLQFRPTWLALVLSAAAAAVVFGGLAAWGR